MGKQKIVLASTSRHRRGLLRRAGLTTLSCVAPRCDEEVDDPQIRADDLVRLLSRRKTESVGGQFPDALIIGSDQVVELDGQILGKPGTPDKALAQLQALVGREHRLVTGVCVFSQVQGRSEVALDVHRMKMWPLDRARLERYIALDQPLDCAGSYRVEAAGITLFESMTGDDFTAIVGLPLCTVAELLARFGVTLLDAVAPGP